MNILLVNDDSVKSKGIWSLYEGFTKQGHNVWMIAPKFENSAMSHAISTRTPLRVEEIQPRVWSVSGTPADCVLMAFEHILINEFYPVQDENNHNKNHIPIDLVVSGINEGPNVGCDILYSGTVAAAVEAMCFGYKSIAISIAGVHNHKFNTATTCLLDLLAQGILDFIDKREILNINIPNLEYEEIQGFSICEAGFSRYEACITQSVDGRNRRVFWIGGTEPNFEYSKYELDFYVLENDRVAITPLKVNFNNYEKMQILTEWMNKVSKN